MVDAFHLGVAVAGLVIAFGGVALYRVAAHALGFVLGAGLALGAVSAQDGGGIGALLAIPVAGIVGAVVVWNLLLFLAWLPGAVGGVVVGTSLLGVHQGLQAILDAGTVETVAIAACGFVGGAITLALHLVFVAVGSAALGALLVSTVLTGQFATFRSATSFSAAVDAVQVFTVWFWVVFVLGLVSQAGLTIADAGGGEAA